MGNDDRMVIMMIAPLLIFCGMTSPTLFHTGKGSPKPSPLMVCPVCKSKTAGRRRTSFLGFRYQICLNCQGKIKLPLPWGFRIAYIIFLVFLIMGLFDPVTGRIDNPIALLFVILILVVFFFDFKLAVHRHKSDYR